MNEGALSTFNKTKNYLVGLVIATFNVSLSHFSDLEKNIVGQRVVPSPAKNMPPKNKPTKKKRLALTLKLILPLGTGHLLAR